MTTPRTKAGKALLALAIIEDGEPPTIVMYRDLMANRILAIEAQARAEAERQIAALREALDRLHVQSPPHSPDDAPCFVLTVLSDTTQAGRKEPAPPEPDESIIGTQASGEGFFTARQAGRKEPDHE